ncbi:MAG: sigma-70 family RNA polymerase sigma factor [Deltaproteobacteria bacterium]|nr:sigma-70 family RNA polymerase sigma factor [Deltaproteobacteria bacterium]NIS77922.1 sigma-70 family RNA polymerase sigma factor [Deltaproteobacteria bacterium]
MVFSLDRKSDEALMKLLSRGREEAFDVLFRRHFQRLVSFFYRSIHDEESAKELAQEVFLRVFRAKETFEERAKFTTWMFTIARNSLINYFRDSKKTAHLVMGSVSDESVYDYHLKRYPSTVPDPSDLAQAAELEVIVQEAVEALPESLRTPFVLAQVNGLSYQEIAQILSITPGAVKLRVFRARETLVAHLGEIGVKRKSQNGV